MTVAQSAQEGHDKRLTLQVASQEGLAMLTMLKNQETEESQ